MSRKEQGKSNKDGVKAKKIRQEGTSKESRKSGHNRNKQAELKYIVEFSKITKLRMKVCVRLNIFNAHKECNIM